MPHTWSPHQLAIFDACEHTSANLIISACAGSGKTTVISECCKRLMRTGGRQVVVCGIATNKPPAIAIYAFNKAIATELQQRGLPGTTFHSQGLAVLRAAGYKPRVDKWKCQRIFESVVDKTLHDDYSDLPRLVSLAKSVANPDPDFAALIDDHMLDVPSTDKAVHFARRILSESNRDLSVIDFDDMLYLPWLLDLPFPRADVVFVDEAQDTNSIQLALLLSTGARIIAVGDRRQAIYGFRGAGTTAIDTLAAATGATELPLSVSYRCARSIVELAQSVAPEIQPHPGAPAGRVTDLGTDWTPDDIPPGAAILCRNTRPLISLAYQLLATGRRAQVRGRDIGRGLIRLLDSYPGPSAGPLTDWLTTSRDAEVDALIAQGKHAKAGAMEDRYNSLLAIVANTGESGARAAIDALFADSTDDAITLSTIHKAKGLEWDHVFLLDPHLLPSKYAVAAGGWQLVQESNLRYVAYTRARQTLTFITRDAAP